MKTQTDIERDINAELQWQPELDATTIAVSVSDGIVTLTGFLGHHRDRYAAERAAKRVSGVIGVANAIEVRLPAGDAKPDPELRREALAAIKIRSPALAGNLRVLAKNGWIELEGETEWQHERLAAEEAVRWLNNVKGITNRIRVAPTAAPDAIERKIKLALKRNAQAEQSRVAVAAHGGEVTLNGTSPSWSKLEEIERVAWSAPGVTNVNNQIVVSDDCGDNDLGSLWIGNRACSDEAANSKPGSMSSPTRAAQVCPTSR